MSKFKITTNDILKISISLSVLIAGCALAYYYVLFLPKQADLKIKREQAQIEQEKKDTEAAQTKRQSDYTRCMFLASEDARDWWNRECKSKGLKDDCLLPQYNADRITDGRNLDEDKCLQLYKAN